MVCLPLASYVQLHALLITCRLVSVPPPCKAVQGYTTIGSLRTSRFPANRLVGLVIKASALRAEDLWVDSGLFPKSSHTSD